MRGKNVKISAMPEEEKEKPTKDLIDVMKTELHERNKKQVKDEDEDEEE